MRQMKMNGGGGRRNTKKNNFKKPKEEGLMRKGKGKVDLGRLLHDDAFADPFFAY